MEDIQFKTLSLENLEEEHICCAFSDKKCVEGYQGKKKWLAEQFEHGYTFKKLDVRGKVFIEYVPAEFAWLPIDAPGFMLINCFWVSGRFKGKGYAKALLKACEEDARGMNGLVAVVARKKQPFMSDKTFYQKQGFELCDTALPYFELWYKAFNKDVAPPKIKEVAKEGECDVDSGLSVYYTSACPFTEYYVNQELKSVAEKHAIPLKINKIRTREEAQNHFVPHTIYSIFFNGTFVTQQILSEKSFEKFILKR